MSAGARIVVARDGVDVCAHRDVDGRPAVLLAHGVGSTPTFLDEALGAPLREAGWATVRAHLRGHGQSTPLPSPEDHALALQAGDLAALALAAEAVVIVGVSLGGHAAVQAAIDGLPGHVRAVGAVLPAWTGTATPGEGPHAGVAAEIRAHGVAGMLGRLRGADDVPAWLRDLLLRDYQAHDPASLEAALLSLDGGDAPAAAGLRGLALPLALVSWPGDPGHPDAVADEWEHLVPGPVAHRRTSIAAVGEDRAEFGRALVAALEDLGITP